MANLILLLMIFLMLIIFTILGMELLRYLKKLNSKVEETNHILDKINEKLKNIENIKR